MIRRLLRIPRLHLVPPLVAVLLALAPAIALAVDTPYFAGNASQEAILSEMAIHPAAVRVGDVTYVAYQGPGYDPYVASYDESTGAWDGPYKAGSNPLVSDAHGAPALWLDAKGYVHVLYGSHHLPMKHAVSVEPYSVSAWRDLAPPSSSATYPQPLPMPDGKLLLFYRQRQGDYYGWVSRTSRDGGYTWDDGFSTVLAGGAYRWYAHFAAGKGGTVLCAFTLYDGDGDDYLGRKNLYYIWRDAHGTWRNIAGDAVTLPVTRTTAAEECEVWDSGSAVVNEVVVKDDPSREETPAPLIQFITGSGRGPDAYEWKFAWHAAGGWTSSTITRTDHDFDAAAFTPHADGSIETFVVTGGSDEAARRPSGVEGRGGTIERWTSPDHGQTWRFAERVSPDEPTSLFSDPQLVENGSSRSRLLFTEWTNDLTLFQHRMYLWGDKGFVTSPTETQSSRIAGGDRVTTAIAASKASFLEGAGTVVLATSQQYPDALSAAPLAAALHGPLLLVPSKTLPSSVVAEVKRLGVTHAVVVGGRSAVSDGVVAALRAQTRVTIVERIAGADRYATSLEVARRLGGVLGPLGKAVVVSGRNFPDALSAAPLAAYRGWPIVLASGTSVGSATSEALSDLEVTSTLVVGDADAVSAGYEAELPEPTRLAGENRYETGAAVVAYSLANGLLPDRLAIASGTRFPDALAGSVLAARARAPMLLATATSLPPATQEVLAEAAAKTVRLYVLGGTSAISDSTLERVESVVRQAQHYETP